VPSTDPQQPSAIINERSPRTAPLGQHSFTKLLQTLSKITTPYPETTFPAVFARVISKFNIFVDLDVNMLLFNCVASMNFHDKLVIMTLFPITCIAYIGLVFVHQRRRKIKASADSTDDGESWGGNRKKLGKLEADCMHYTLVFVHTIFSLVSTTIIQTFNYDDRLEIVTCGGVFPGC
jgi:hypothetical protein